MRPLSTWRAYGTVIVICGLCIAIHVGAFHFLLVSQSNLIIIYTASVLVQLFFYFALFNIAYNRWRMCDAIQALSSYCLRHPLPPTAWNSLLASAILIATNVISYISWVFVAFLDYEHIFGGSGLLQALVYDCLKGLTTLSRPNTADRWGHSQSFLSKDSCLFWRDMRIRYQFLLDIFLYTRNLFQYQLAYNYVDSFVVVTLQLTDYIAGQYNSTEGRPNLQLVTVVLYGVPFLMMCLAFQRIKSENCKMSEAITLTTQQFRILDCTDEVYMFLNQIGCQETEMCTVLWMFDLNSTTALKVVSAVVYYMVVMRQSDIKYLE